MSVEPLMPQYIVENNRAISLQLMELNSIDSTKEKSNLVQDLVPAGCGQGKKIRALPKPLSLQGACEPIQCCTPPGSNIGVFLLWSCGGVGIDFNNPVTKQISK